MPIIVDRDKCNGCETCISVCPFDAIKIKDDGKASINEYCQMCMACLSACPEGAIIEIKEEGAPISYQPSDYKGIWVFAEQREGSIASVSLELLGAGRKLADELKTELSAVLFGATEKDANELIKWGQIRYITQAALYLKNSMMSRIQDCLLILLKNINPP